MVGANLRITRAILGLVFGFVLGSVVPLQAQTQDGTQANPYVITQSGGWNHTVQCDASNLALTLSIDGATAVPAAGVTWAGAAAPYTATIPLSQMPAAARTVGTHAIAVTTPATTITLADGSLYTYPAGTLTSYMKVLPDTAQPNPPRNPHWIKIAGTMIVAALVTAAVWFGWHRA